ncbi:T7SS effector LXG polymorphic toxin [Paraliobacillus sp. JSM ZJ581]|uniref:T7SS effector LXG polymorphic toxin n=1 Tax=Paraliobacillus sp. JSM ZJ581 TaxID=3342118 RepID=UPI0035A8CF48
MGQRVDLAEVRNFADDYYSYVNNLIDQFLDVKSAIKQINRMDSFKGSAANRAKGSLHNFHMQLLQHFENLMIDLLDNIDNHIGTFLSQIDSSDQAIIQGNYL